GEDESFRSSVVHGTSRNRAELLPLPQPLQIPLHLLENRGHIQLRLRARLAVKALQALIDDLLRIAILQESLALLVRDFTSLLLLHFLQRALDKLLPLLAIHLVQRIHHLLKAFRQCEVQKARLFVGTERAKKLVEPAIDSNLTSLVVAQSI